MARVLAAAFLFHLAVLAGCGDGSSTTGPGGPDDPTADMGAGYPVWNAQNPAICGQTPYTWLPASSVGQLLESADHLSLSTIELFFLSTAAFLGSQLNVHHALNHSVQTAVIRYQTQDRGKLVDATAMVAWPTSGGKTFPSLLFLHPTLGYTDGCAPSARAGDITGPMTILSLLAAASGYAAVFPDYLNQRSLGGPSTEVSPYLLMEPTAIASLDALRAAQTFLSTKKSVTATSDVYVWGHSQGAQAAEFVSALQPLYAPELTLKAVAPISPPSDLAASAKANFGGPAPTYNLGEAIAYAWTNYYDPTKLGTALKPPWGTMAPTQLQNYCKSGYTDPIKSVTDPTQVFTQGFLDSLTQGAQLEPWSCWLHYNSPATMGPALNKSAPMLYVTGDMDTTVVPAANDPVSAKWCSEGVKIQYLQCSGADHTHTIVNSIDDVLSFFDARQKGMPLPADLCQPKAPTKCASTP